MLDGQNGNLDELNYLAKRLDSLDKKEWRPFLAAAEATHANDVARLINLTFNLHCYSLVDDFNDMEKMGKQLYLNEHLSISPGEKHDYRQYALDILAQPPLAANQYGLVFTNSNQPEQVYNGRQFPQYRYSGDVAGMLTIQSEAGTEYLDLPCEEIALAKALHRLGAESPEDCKYSFENESLPKSAAVLFEHSDNPTDDFTRLNELANAISQLSADQCGDFLALCAWAKPDTLADHVTLCKSLDDFQLVPGVTNLQEYGRKLLLENWKLPDHAALDYIDFEGYAKHRLTQMPGQFSEYGLLKYVGNSQETAQLANLPFQQPNYTTLRLFSPVYCDYYEQSEYGLSEYPDRLDAAESASYQDSIAEMVEVCKRHDGPRGLAPYLDRGSLADKVYSMMPTVEEYDGKLYGVLECRLREPLTEQEYEQLCSEWSGQMSDGFGESLEQQEIKVDDGVLNVHLWESGKNWSIQSEAQLKGEPEQGFELRMQ
ncbi:MAG: hypothetical protein RSG86_07695 [Oscillospiraceae bacterium]